MLLLGLVDCLFLDFVTMDLIGWFAFALVYLVLFETFGF